MQHKKVALACLLIAVIIGVSYGAIQYMTPIQNDVTIKGYEIKLWRLDTDVEVTSISWGTLNIGQEKNTDTVLGLPTATHKLAIKNTGNYVAYVGWQIDPETPLPTGVTMTGQHANIETEAYQQTWNENVFTFSVLAGSVSTWRIRWTLSVSEGVTKGDYNFNILLLAADTNTG